MNTIEYLDAVKAKRGISSDYALAKALQIGQSAIIGYRARRRIIDDEVSLSIAQILEINPLEVIATANAERAKTPEMKARWTGVMEKFSASFNALLLGTSPIRTRRPAC